VRVSELEPRDETGAEVVAVFVVILLLILAACLLAGWLLAQAFRLL
jgi:hypothetical protein